MIMHEIDGCPGSLDTPTPADWDAAAKILKCKAGEELRIMESDHSSYKCIKPLTLEERSMVVQTDGGSATYYSFEVPTHVDNHIHELGTMEARHVIEMMLENDFDKGNIFKALVRIGRKRGVDARYDLNKCRFFLDCIEEKLGA